MTETIVKVKNGTIKIYRSGSSSDPVLFLHGGPGDTHHYMAKMAKPLINDVDCIFFDQRGSGESQIKPLDRSTLTIDLMIEDIEKISLELGLAQVRIVGHSWGSTLGLHYAIRYPNRVRQLGLINLGPLDRRHEAICRKKLTLYFSDEEKAKWTTLCTARKKALEENQIQLVQKIDRDLMKLRVRAWVFNTKLHRDFLKDYFSDPPPNRLANQLICESARDAFDWHKLPLYEGKLWICSGRQDFEPLEQVDRICRYLPQTEAITLDKCAHIPWLDRPEKFYNSLSEFLAS